MGVKRFVWDEVSDNVLLETDETDSVTARYRQLPGQFGELLSQERSGKTSFYHYDGNASTCNLTDDSETVTDTTLYTAYGEEVSSSGSTTNPFGYKGAVGYYTNESTGDIYVRNRSYEPAKGRWSSKDPLGFVDGTSLYRAYFVPSGMDPKGLEREFDPTWICSSGCFEYCMAAGFTATDCNHYCSEKNSCPSDWPKPEGPGPMHPPCWIVEQQVLGQMSVEDWMAWEPKGFERPDGSEKCNCRLSGGDHRCSIERPTGTNGNVSTPGLGDADCKIGEVVLAKYKGVCQGNDDCCTNERGGCQVLALWRCDGKGKLNKWKRRTFMGKCE